MGMGNAGGAGLGNLGLLEVPHTQTLDLGPGDQPPLLDPAHLDLEGLLRKHFNISLKPLIIMQLPLLAAVSTDQEGVLEQALKRRFLFK